MWLFCLFVVVVLMMPNPLPKISDYKNVTKTLRGGYRSKRPSHPLTHTDLISQNTTTNGKRGSHSEGARWISTGSLALRVLSCVPVCMLGKRDICGLPKVRSQLF